MGPLRPAAIVSAALVLSAVLHASPSPPAAVPLSPTASAPQAPSAAHPSAAPAASAPQAPPANKPLPSSSDLIKRMRAAIRFDEDLQQAYTYLERRRDVKISMLGKVTVGPLRTFEVYPSNQPGRTYKRLIAVEGKPLPAAELAQRDELHRRDVLADVERDKAETPALKSARQAKEAQERREREQIVNDAFAVFEATVIGRDVIDGQNVIVLWITPRRAVPARTREGGYMKKFAGKLWVVEADAQIVKLDLTAFDDIPVGMGFVGRVHQGARLEFARRRVNNETWLPASSHISAKGRTLMFRPFVFDVRSDYQDYKKWSVETKVTFDGPKE
jgi:hypothetical protein